jgi:hypothetical protein
MKKIRFGIVTLILLVSLSSIATPAEAQRKKTVVRKGRAGRTVVISRPRHNVVVRRAHVRYAGLPRWGAVVTTMPTTAVIIKGRHPYHFHNGVYYETRGANYVVVRPRPGVRIRVLPAGYRTVVMGPARYYYYYGTFYTKVADEYSVVAPPVGAVVDALPEGYEVKSIDGNEYYLLDGTYYAEVDASEFDDGVGYEVVEL